MRDLYTISEHGVRDGSIEGAIVEAMTLEHEYVRACTPVLDVRVILGWPSVMQRMRRGDSTVTDDRVELTVFVAGPEKVYLTVLIGYKGCAIPRRANLIALLGERLEVLSCMILHSAPELYGPAWTNELRCFLGVPLAVRFYIRGDGPLENGRTERWFRWWSEDLYSRLETLMAGMYDDRWALLVAEGGVRYAWYRY